MKHTISVQVENKFGVLARIAGMFSGRGFNIDSLTVGPTLDPDISMMTIVVRGDDRTLEQVDKQLNRLVNVIRVDDLTGSEFINRELVLVKVAVDAANRPEVVQIADLFKGKIVDVQPTALTIEITGNEDKVEAFIALMQQYEILALTRTGKIAVSKGTGPQQTIAPATPVKIPVYA
jgi:acetolactate synthase-1/3 small subunit